ncbi:MAG: hypothetical protein C0506_06160 [Anaerolinea sp.]|nr:hypothetical protein [Anaerolinea sp.]
MDGPAIIARSMSLPFTKDVRGRAWQYHSRSDRHSKIACWAIMFDLLRECPLLAGHVERSVVGFGINHEMREFTTNRKKNLDLVICTPREGQGEPLPGKAFAELVSAYGVALSDDEMASLRSLPPFLQRPTGSVRVALEAKAAMTAHIRAIPRLFDELNSSHLTIHASSDVALAGGFVMINTAAEFISPDLNKSTTPGPDVVSANQPHGAERVLEKIQQIPRRARAGQDGFDAFGVLLISMRNDGGPVTVVPGPDNGGAVFRYEQMVRRLAQLYEARYNA